MATNNRADAPSAFYTYETGAARASVVAGVPITSRQLKRWVEAGKVTMTKVGHRVYFTEAQIQELADSLVVRAVR